MQRARRIEDHSPGLQFHLALSVEPIDQKFPQVKAVVWFQIAKREFIPAQKGPGQYQWFKNEWADYRIGGGVEEGKTAPSGPEEIDVYRALTRNPYFLSRIENKPVVAAGAAATKKPASGG